MQDDADLAAKAAEKAGREIVAAYEKLAARLRRYAEAAMQKAEVAKGAPKRAVARRRFELFSDAATEAELRVEGMRARFAALGRTRDGRSQSAS